MADGSITFKTDLDNSSLEKRLNEAERSVRRLKDQLEKQLEKKSFIEAEMDDAKQSIEATERTIEALKGKIEAVKESMASGETHPMIGKTQIGVFEQNIADAQAKLEQQNEALAEQQRLYKQVDGEVAKIDGALGAAKQKQAALAEEARAAYSGTNTLSARASASIDEFGKKVGVVTRRLFTFAIVAKAANELKNYIAAAAKEDMRFQASVANLAATVKGALVPLVSTLVPMITAAVNGLAAMVMTLARLVDMVFKTNIVQTIEQARSAATASEYAADATDDQAKATNNLAKAQKKAVRQLMAFDEINALQASDMEDFGDGMADQAGLLGSAPNPTWDGIDVGKIDAVLAKIMLSLGAALLAVGAILAFSGVNVPLGLAMMALGALMVYTAAQEQWDKLPQETRDAINSVIVITGVVLLALGAVLAFSGVNVPLGIGMIAAGAVLLLTAAALNWDVLPDEVKGVVVAIELVLGAALLAVGAVLAFSAVNTPLGIAMMATGAALIFAAATLQWDSLPKEIQDTIAVISLAVGGAMLALGAVLAFSGVALPLGIALMAAGAALTFTAVALQWEKLPDEVKNTVRVITMVVGTALLALGAALAFSGVALPLGIGLMAAGAALIATSAALDWDKLPQDIKNTVSTILAIVGGALLVLGIVLCFTGVALPLGIALIAAGAVSLIASAAINWDFLKQKIQEIWQGIVSWFNQNVAPIFTWQWWADKFKAIANGLIYALNCGLDMADGFVNGLLGGLASLAGVFGIDLRYTPVSSLRIPYLAQGAVIPPNREFMAVLGDQRNGRNLEAPESLIRQIVSDETGRQLAAAMQMMQTGQQGGDVTLVLRVGSEELARATARGSASLARRGQLSTQLAFS